ncbi:MAG TPA: diaminopimelate epimerase [Tepidisphaeraceae bacterium]|jgi:diaminopimelate epimerase|nr:diaminopimelate epimerase [Tepidisphaeraceae bacterium]
MKFTKMHGLGNDYIYVNGFKETVENPEALSRVISDRHFGIGSDGLIVLLPSDKADCRMRMFNIDGSEGEMCGNGIRCLAKFAYDHGTVKRNPMRIETGRGVRTLDLKLNSSDKVELITVKMGEPSLELEQIPVDPSMVTKTAKAHVYQLSAVPGEKPVEAVFVNIGNPHAIIYTDNVDAIPLERVGPLMENHPAFPRRANVHWVQVISPTEIKMRTWERGSGITLACGTGASSVCVAGFATGRTGRKILAHLPGGDLRLEWRESDNNVYMTGPATEVFSGEWNQS